MKLIANRLLMAPPAFKAYLPSVRFDSAQTNVFVISVKEHLHRLKDVKNVLSAPELDKAARFKNDKDRASYCVGKYCLRQLLSTIMAKDPVAVNFTYGDFAKPATDGIAFNISHAEDFVIIGISPAPIGLDIEFTKRNFDFQSILETCFSVNEIRFIDKNALNFYTLWTRKEALLKAIGEGLSDNLQQIDGLAEILQSDGKKFTMKSFLLDTDYLVSVAISESYSSASYWRWL